MERAPALYLLPLGLTFAVRPGETAATILARFNTYRSPERQVTALWTPTGEPIAIDQSIIGYTVAWIQKPPVARM